MCIEEPNSERVFDRIFAEIAGFVWFVSLGLLKIVFGVSCLAVQIGAFIGIVVDSRQSVLLHVIDASFGLCPNLFSELKHCCIEVSAVRPIVRRPGVRAFQEPVDGAT